MDRKQIPRNEPDPSAASAQPGPGEVGRRVAIDLLRAWRSGDAREQTETLEFLKQALDEQRAPGCKLFAES